MKKKRAVEVADKMAEQFLLRANSPAQWQASGMGWVAVGLGMVQVVGLGRLNRGREH